MDVKEKKYFQLRLELTGFNPDILSAILFKAGALGVEEIFDGAWLAYFPGDFNSEKFLHLVEELRKIHPGFREEQMLVSPLKAVDWIAEWKRFFRPTHMTSHVWVAPPWGTPKIKPDEHLIIIDPQMAFGTGRHESTRLAAQAMQEYWESTNRVLDAGTGSGILSILAHKLGATDIVGFDAEPEAIENARHNAALNGCRNIIFLVGNESVIPEKEFDLILANINRPVLVKILPVLESRLRDKGRIILSGLVVSDKQKMRKAVTAPLSILRRYEMEEWLALVLEKKIA